MSNYRRLISYIYAYEGTVKGKNIGFAKLESRNGQCRISVSVKKVYVGGNDMGVYLLSDGGEILLGKIFIRSGAGEFRTAVKSDNVEESGKALENCYGLTVHDVQDSWRAYTTIWDDGIAREAGDAVAYAAEVELAGVTSENLRKQSGKEEEASEMTTFQLLQTPPPEMCPGQEAEPETAGESESGWKQEVGVEPKDGAEPETEAEPEGQCLERPAGDETGETMNVMSVEAAKELSAPDSGGSPQENRGMRMLLRENGLFSPSPERWNFGSINQVRPGRADISRFAVRDRPVSGYMSGAGSVKSDTDRLKGERTGTSGSGAAPGRAEPMPARREMFFRMSGGNIQTEMPASAPTSPETTAADSGPIQAASPVGPGSSPTVSSAEPSPIQAAPASDQEVALPREPEEEPENAGPLDPVMDAEAVWDSFRKQYPKIDAFDYENGCEILKIRPQDIGLLPRENWTYGNNSFLLHGYYNYRCLILVRLNNPGGKARFLLGVPGHYFSNEKYMASMFGFPHFVLSKKQPLDNGRFGYWYTDVRLGQ